MATNTLRVCATPDTGFWTLDDDVDLLWSTIAANGGNFTVPCSEIGKAPSRTPASGNYVTGFAPEMLLLILEKMGGNWDCVVSLLPTYQSALYATTKQKVCDVAYSPFTVSPPRAYCGTTRLPEVAACPVYDPSVTWASATPTQACCASFSYHMMLSTIGGIVRQDDNILDPSGATAVLELAEATLMLLSWVGVIVIVFAHIVWIVEKTNTNLESRIFSLDYMPGIFDAVWWTSSVIMMYGGEAPQTPCGRTCALMGMIIGAAFLSLFTALLSSALTAARLATATYKFTQLREQDVTSKTRICTPSTAYPEEYGVLLAADTYTAPDNSLSTCLDDLEHRRCDIVAYDEPTLRASVHKNSTMGDLFMVIPGEDDLVLASAFSAEVVSEVEGTFEQAVVTLHNVALELADTYFPATTGIEEEEATSFLDSEAALYIPLGIVVAFFLFACLANMIESARNGQKCILVRLSQVCRNEARKAKLRRALDVEDDCRIDDLEPHARAVFSTIDADGSGEIDERELEVLTVMLSERRPDGTMISPKDTSQLRSMLLQLFNANIDGIISPWQFQEAYSTLTSDTAKRSLLELVKEMRRKIVAPNYTQQSSFLLNNKERVVPMVAIAVETAQPSNREARRNNAVLQKLDRHRVHDFVASFRAADIDDTGTLDRAELAMLVDQFADRHTFSVEGVAALRSALLEFFDENHDGVVSIDEFEKMYGSALESPEKQRNFQRVMNVGSSITDHDIILAKVKELEVLLTSNNTCTSPGPPAKGSNNTLRMRKK